MRKSATRLGRLMQKSFFLKPYDLLMLRLCQEVVNKIQDITSSSVIITTRLLHSTQTEVFICDKVAAAAAECINY